MTINDLKGGYKVVGVHDTAPIPQSVPTNPISGAISAVQQGVSDIGNTLQRATPTLGGQIAKGAELAGQVTSLPFAPISGAVSTLIPNQVKQAYGTAVQDVADKITNNPQALQALQTINSLTDQHPDVARLLSGLGTTAFNVGTMTQGAKPTGEALGTAGGAISDASKGVSEKVAPIAGGTGRFLGGQLTGLSPSTIGKIIENPSAFSKEAQSTITRPALAEDITKAIEARQGQLAETGTAYSGIRKSTQPIPIQPNYLDSLIQGKTGLSVQNGRLIQTGKSALRSPSEVSALQTKLYDIWKPEFDKGYLTPEEFLNFRTDLGKIAYNENGVKNTDLAHLGSVIRGQANTDLRQHIPGLENLDKQFAPQQIELGALTKGLVDKNGNLTDGAINRIANATGKGKDPQLARLETLSPGITDRIKILKAVEDLQNSRENKPGTYLRAGALGAGIVSLNPFLIVAAVSSLPEVAVPLLRGLGYTKEAIANFTKTLGIGSVQNETTPSTVK